MRVFMAILCSLLAVCSVSARDSCQKGTDGQASIYRLPPLSLIHISEPTRPY